MPVLFVMLCGFQPFKVPHPGTDWWYNAVVHGRYDRFWAAHLRSGPHMANNLTAQDLFNRMFVPDPAARLTLKELVAHHWVTQSDSCDSREIAAAMDSRRQSVVEYRKSERLKRANERAARLRNNSGTYDPFTRDTQRAFGIAPTYCSDYTSVSKYRESIFFTALDAYDALICAQKTIKNFDGTGTVEMDVENFSLQWKVSVVSRAVDADLLDDNNAQLIEHSFPVSGKISVFSCDECNVIKVSLDEGDIFDFQIVKKAICEMSESPDDSSSSMLHATDAHESILEDDMGMM